MIFVDCFIYQFFVQVIIVFVFKIGGEFEGVCFCGVYVEQQVGDGNQGNKGVYVWNFLYGWFVI